MIRMPAIRGVIRRRVLVNYRVDPDVLAELLPSGLRPKLHGGAGMAGICLIRLEQIRPSLLPFPLGLRSENAAHRIAVEWDDEHGQIREGVYIPRRDSSSFMNRLAGGRLFPGEHQRATFDVADDGIAVALAMRSADGETTVELRGRRADSLPDSSRFASLADASCFFENGAVGLSARRHSEKLDAIRLETDTWRVEPLTVERVTSSYFDDPRHFPSGSVEFDCALIMRDIPHEWHAAGGLPDAGHAPVSSRDAAPASSARSRTQKATSI
ncbi:MAG TPA: DUF2071 domain-containing protein [Thermomicrobiales bacterium]|nr:DUF2071 domain-containing protein [Thermomicrobiales bacterium]